MRYPTGTAGECHSLIQVKSGEAHPEVLHARSSGAPFLLAGPMTSARLLSIVRSIAVIGLSLGCGGPTTPDGGNAGDAGTLRDAGAVDGGALASDAGASDAGVDAGAPDAGVNAADAGTGCASDAECSSGVCLPTHSCATCQGDAECADGLRCGTGVCSDACVASSGALLSA